MDCLPKVTIVVCIWNVEKTIHRAVDAILSQSYKNLEVILMDDESPDRCPQICEEYAKKDCRVVALHKNDEGLAMARNYAMAKATGDFITFFDPDDWVEQDCIESMVKKIIEDDADMVICDYYHNDQYSQTYAKQSPTSLDHWSVLEDIASGRLFGYCWNKLLRFDLIKSKGVFFPKGFYCDDQYVMCSLLKDSIKVTYLPKAFYHYVYGSASLSRRYDEDSYRQDIVIRNAFYQLLKDTPSANTIYQSKTCSIFSRAFLFGQNVYSSKQFKDTFSEYYPYVNSSGVESFFFKLSVMGFYFVSRFIFGFLFDAKQLFKKIQKKNEITI